MGAWCLLDLSWHISHLIIAWFYVTLCVCKLNEYILFKKALLVEITLTASVAPRDYFAVTAAMSQLQAEAIYWTTFKSFGKYE